MVSPASTTQCTRMQRRRGHRDNSSGSTSATGAWCYTLPSFRLFRVQGKVEPMSVNYFNTLITVADDCPVTEAVVPPRNDAKPTVAAEQFRLISEHPYELTSEEVIFQLYADKHAIPEDERSAAREEYFSVGRACLRTSPLAKKFGWGIHSDGEGRIALIGMQTEEYRRVQCGARGTKVVKAMRSSRKPTAGRST